MDKWRPVKKIAAAIYVGVIVETGVLISALSGAMSWRDAGIAMLAAAMPIVAGYMKSDTTLLEDGVGVASEDDVEFA